MVCYLLLGQYGQSKGNIDWVRSQICIHCKYQYASRVQLWIRLEEKLGYQGLRKEEFWYCHEKLERPNKNYISFLLIFY